MIIAKSSFIYSKLKNSFSIKLKNCFFYIFGNINTYVNFKNSFLYLKKKIIYFFNTPQKFNQ